MDPIANLLCCIRNGQHANKTYVSVPYSKVVWIIVHVLYTQGYIKGMGIRKQTVTYRKYVGIQKRFYAARICIVLKATEDHAHAIRSIVRVSSPKKRVYLPVHHLRNTMHPFGIRVVSTTKGIMTDIRAVEANLGGEVLCACV